MSIIKHSTISLGKVVTVSLVTLLPTANKNGKNFTIYHKANWSQSTLAHACDARFELSSCRFDEHDPGHASSDVAACTSQHNITRKPACCQIAESFHLPLSSTWLWQVSMKNSRPQHWYENERNESERERENAHTSMICIKINMQFVCKCTCTCTSLCMPKCLKSACKQE